MNTKLNVLKADATLNAIVVENPQTQHIFLLKFKKEYSVSQYSRGDIVIFEELKKALVEGSGVV